ASWSNSAARRTPVASACAVAVTDTTEAARAPDTRRAGMGRIRRTYPLAGIVELTSKIAKRLSVPVHLHGHIPVTGRGPVPVPWRGRPRSVAVLGDRAGAVRAGGRVVADGRQAGVGVRPGPGQDLGERFARLGGGDAVAAVHDEERDAVGAALGGLALVGVHLGGELGRGEGVAGGVGVQARVPDDLDQGVVGEDGAPVGEVRIVEGLEDLVLRAVLGG